MSMNQQSSIKRNRWFKWIGVAGLALMLSALAAPRAEAQTVTVTAFVVKQVCANSDFARVTLSAKITPSQPAKYHWDFTNNGTFDTPFSSIPTVNHLYREDRRFTARVQAITARGVVRSDTVTFLVKSCGGPGGP